VIDELKLSLSPTEPFGPMVAGHGLQIDFGVLRESPGEDEAAFDLGTSEVWIRARDRAGELVEGRERQLAKVAGDGGFVSDVYPCGDATTTPLHWSIVVVDLNGEEGATDRIVHAWRQQVRVTTP